MRNSFVKNPLITISYDDLHGSVIKRFDDTWSLAQFFRDNPEVAVAFKYLPKSQIIKPTRIIDDLWECMKVFVDHDFSNNLLGCDKGRILALESRYIDKHANGYYLTKEGKEFIEKMKPLMLKK